jgi:hypothetical protein
MTALLRRLGAVGVIVVCTLPTFSGPALAITAELARKCRDLAVKAQPYRRAGSAQGTAQAEREYYRQCIAKEGKKD